MRRVLILSLSLVLSAGLTAQAQDAPAKKKAASKAAQAKRAPLPAPTQSDVAYGKHPKQVMHFWKAQSETPTPVLINIHGGGWTGGDRTGGLSPQIIDTYLKAGISVVSVEYRFIEEATADGEKPPVRGPLRDAARAVQFVRSKAKEWNIDKTKVAATGGSAGACSSLWLAFHNDLADPKSDDPVARESTRLTCAAVNGAQTSLDPKQMKEWTPNSRYGAHAFGFKGDKSKNLSAFDECLANRDSILAWIAEYSPYALVTRDDPPVYLLFGTPPALGKEEKDPTHTANFGLKLQEKCKETGVPCELVYPGAPDVSHKGIQAYVIEHLKK